MDGVSLETEKFGGVVQPGVAGQSGLEAGLLQESSGVEMVFHGHARQKQSAVRSACDLQTVHADSHLAHSVFAPGGDFFRPPQQPNLHIQKIQFLGGDGWEAGIVLGRPIGRMADGLGQRGRGAEITAAGAQMALPLETHKRPVDRQIGRFGKGILEPLGPRHLNHRRYPASGGPKHSLLFFLAEPGFCALIVLRRCHVSTRENKLSIFLYATIKPRPLVAVRRATDHYYLMRDRPTFGWLPSRLYENLAIRTGKRREPQVPGATSNRPAIGIWQNMHRPEWMAKLRIS